MEKGNRLTDEEGKKYLESGFIASALVIVFMTLVQVFIAFKDYDLLIK